DISPKYCGSHNRTASAAHSAPPRKNGRNPYDKIDGPAYSRRRRSAADMLIKNPASLRLRASIPVSATERSVSHPRHHLPIVNLRVWRALDAQDTDQSTLHSRQGVIDNGVVARHLGLELGDDGAAGSNAHGLNAFERRRLHPAERIDPVEDGADDVERRRKVRAADTKEDAHRFADPGLQRMQFRQRTDGTIEDEVFRMLAQQFLDAEFGAAVLAVGHVGIDFALHD